ncbi:MAG TPA: hypothetical protein VGB91_12020 [Rhizomicrobium sp.]
MAAGAEGACGPGPDVEIRWAPLDPVLAGARHRGPAVQIADGEIQLAVGDIARYRMRAGSEIVIDALPGASDRDVRAYLLGGALGLLCHQRALLPLHANAVVVRDRAVAIAGRSGAGKSTLAAHYHDKGYDLLSDDVCAITFPEAGHPLAWSGIPRLRLWRDSAEASGRDVDRLDPVADGLDKYHWPVTLRAPQQGLPLARIYVLTDTANCSQAEISRLRGGDALEAVMEQTFRREYLGVMDGAAQRFARGIALLARVPVFRVAWPHDYRRLAAEAARLEDHMLDDAAGAGGGSRRDAGLGSGIAVATISAPRGTFVYIDRSLFGL